MASFSQSSIEKGSDLVREYLCSGSACKDKSTVAEVYCETCDKLFCKKCCGLHDQLFTGHNVLGKEHENKWSVSKEKDRTSQKLKVDSSRPQPGNKDPSKNLVLNKSAAIKQRVSKTSKAVEMPAKKPSQGQVTTRPSRDASTAGAQGHVSSDNVSGRRAGLNDDKKKAMREGTFRTDAEKDQSELFKDELRNQVSNLERRLQQLEVERVRNEKEQENRRLEEQRVRMQLEYEEEKKKIKAREEELNNRERHLQQLEKERVRKEEREKRRLEEQRVSMQLEYEEAQKKIKAREAEVLKRQADERKKEAEQKRREADDEKLRKQQEQSGKEGSWNRASNHIMHPVRGQAGIQQATCVPGSPQRNKTTIMRNLSG
ncbi:trichohyalin-like [Dreissena polymorpha]|uniref:trichohyalin-like n=1 Tax=Dreissena polymorpha TaxID=45954 RepID=UPI00226408C8|nr:trichohyalin-like [Dreissena polymorpha]